jgi:hypothetical protein
MSPAPNTGVGIRKITLSRASSASKSSCSAVQLGASSWPLITKRLWTPPSREPSGRYLNRASRTGPSKLMKEGRTLPLKTSGMEA